MTNQNVTLPSSGLNYYFYLKGASQLPQAVPSASVQSSGAGPGGGRSNKYFGPAGQATEEPALQTDGLLCARRDSGGKRCFLDNCYQQSNIQTELKRIMGGDET